MADAKDSKAEDAAPAGPKMIMGFPLPIFAFFAANLLITLGALGYITQISLFYTKPAITETQVQKEITKKVTKHTEEETGFFTENYPEMQINLRGQQGGKLHFAVIEVSIACGSENCLGQVKENKAKIQDAIQMAISKRTYTELGTLDTKFRIKHEILDQVNSWLKNTAATDILFTQFIVQ